MRSEQQLQSRADRLLKRSSVTEPPVNVEAVARSLNVRLRFEPDDGDVSGALYREQDSTVIAVNSRDAWVRQRFTIAHELGHLLLHTDQKLFIDRYYPREGDVPPRGRYHRDVQSSQAIHAHEIEANKFAACLLMPRRLLLRDTRSLLKPIRSNEIQKLAARYQVSQQAMLFRLQNLGVAVEEA